MTLLLKKADLMRGLNPNQVETQKTWRQGEVVTGEHLAWNNIEEKQKSQANKTYKTNQRIKHWWVGGRVGPRFCLTIRMEHPSSGLWKTSSFPPVVLAVEGPLVDGGESG